MKVESFKTREETIRRISEMRVSLSIQPERVRDPEDPKADENGYVWVISVSLQESADALFLCTDGCIR